jgi:hypothetical protein
MSDYENFRLYWESWKRNSNEPEKPEDAKVWRETRSLFKAAAGISQTDVDEAAQQFLILSAAEMRTRLKQLPNWNPDTQRLTLYRGYTDKKAIQIRCGLFCSEEPHRPISFTPSKDSALGFAQRHHVDGVLASIEIPITAVVFADLDGLCTFARMDLEQEVVVLLPETTALKIEQRNVPRIKPALLNHREKREFEDVVRQLKLYEESLQPVPHL